MGTQQDALAKQDLKNLILRDRKTNSKRTWRGSFLDYLELIRKNPSSAGLAHARIYEVITKIGSSQVLETDYLRVKRLYQDEPVPVYDFFQAEFFGVEKTVAQIVRYFRSAALKGEESRQVLYLMGPVGSGKSSLVQKIKSGLEEMGPFYAIENCPIHEETLHLLPRHLRPAFEEMLGVQIEGDLCPIFRTRLKQEFGIRYEEMPIVTREFSSRSRVGIAAVPPLRSPFWERDLRFRRRSPKLLFLLHRFVSTKYTSTEVVFISHDTEGPGSHRRGVLSKK